MNAENFSFRSVTNYLKGSNVGEVRLLRPGYTRYTPSHIARELTVSDKELQDFCLRITKKYTFPIHTSPDIDYKNKLKNILCSLFNLFKTSKHLSKKRKLFLCAKSVKNILPIALEAMEIQNYEIKTVKSKVFGGNVDCAGLLLVEDYISAIEEFFEQSQTEKPEVVILPRASFDINMEDLSMTPVKKIEDIFNINLILA